MLVDSLNFSYRNGELSTSQKQAIITLIEKRGKDRRYIKCWRPVSLINVGVKIGSKCIAKRLEKVLPTIIHHNQNAYVKGRTIFHTVRTIDDLLQYTKSNKIDALLTTLDFEKAYDMLSRNFLIKALKKFNFGSSFISWVSMFYTNITSCVINNGFTTPFFDVLSGVRQGDPLSPFLFIISLELLSINIRNNVNINGITVNNEEIKVLAFADDLTAFVKDRNSFFYLMETLDLWEKFSGLRINNDKTEIFILGSMRIKAEELNVEEIKSVVKILGIYFTYNMRIFQKLNQESIIEFIKQKVKGWKGRGLTLIGKIQLIKTFIIPKVLYFLSVSSGEKCFINEINNLLFEFLWNGKADKVRRVAIINTIEKGGQRWSKRNE